MKYFEDEFFGKTWDFEESNTNNWLDFFIIYKYTKKNFLLQV